MNELEPLARALLEAALFLEFCEDDIVDPDAAVQQMEQMGATLATLESDTKQRFLAFCAVMANEFQARSPEQAEFLTNFGNNFGLTESTLN